MGNLVIFVMQLLNNWLVKVTETFTNILNYYVLQTTANKFAAYVKMYVVKKYLKVTKAANSITNATIVCPRKRKKTLTATVIIFAPDLSINSRRNGHAFIDKLSTGTHCVQNRQKHFSMTFVSFPPWWSFL